MCSTNRELGGASGRPTLDVVLLQVYPLQEGDEVGPTFPRPVLGAGQNVSARQRDGNALLLEETRPPRGQLMLILAESVRLLSGCTHYLIMSE